MSAYDLVELCCGTAALTFHLCGQKAPVSMAGSKKTLAPQLVDLMQLDGLPRNALLVDAGEWGVTLGTLFAGQWNAAADVLDRWASEPERELFDRLRLNRTGGMAPLNRPSRAEMVERAAAHLWLQARTFRGKEVYPTNTGWKTHGFDPEWRGAANPSAKPRGAYNSRPVLAKKLRDLGAYWQTPNAPCVLAAAVRAPAYGTIDLLSLLGQPRIVVFIDPPYRGREGYRHSLPRVEVVQLALRNAQCGRDVYVAEGEPIAELIAEGWSTHQLATRRMGTQLSKTSHEEWITYRRAS